MTTAVRPATPTGVDAIAEAHTAAWASAYRAIFSDAELVARVGGFGHAGRANAHEPATAARWTASGSIPMRGAAEPPTG